MGRTQRFYNFRDDSILKKSCATYRSAGNRPMSVEIVSNILRTKAIFVDTVAAQEDVVRGLPINDVPAGLDTWDELTNSQPTYFTGEDPKKGLLQCQLIFSRVTGLTKMKRDDDGNLFEVIEDNNEDLEKCRNASILVIAADEWKLSRSPTGLYCMVPKGTRFTDQIFVLMGASVPFVLREIDGSYQIIGQAYVHGYMQGYAVQVAEKHAAEESESERNERSQIRPGYYQHIDII